MKKLVLLMIFMSLMGALFAQDDKSASQTKHKKHDKIEAKKAVIKNERVIKKSTPEKK